MAAKPTIKRKLATIELADGTVHTDVRIINPDVMRYQLTAEKHGWPHMTVKNEVATVPHIQYEETFTCWAALTRLDLYSGKWEAFRDSDCVGLVVTDEAVDPTRADGMPPAENDSYLNSQPSIQGSLSGG